MKQLEHCHDMNLVEAARARFRPDQIMTLFIGESAPDSDKFFYFGKNPMLTYTRKAIEQALGSDNGDIRERFKALGWYLDDLSLVPVNTLAPAMRKATCHAARPQRAQ